MVQLIAKIGDWRRPSHSVVLDLAAKRRVSGTQVSTVHAAWRRQDGAAIRNRATARPEANAATGAWQWGGSASNRSAAKIGRRGGGIEACQRRFRCGEGETWIPGTSRCTRHPGMTGLGQIRHPLRAKLLLPFTIPQTISSPPSPPALSFSRRALVFRYLTKQKRRRVSPTASDVSVPKAQLSFDFTC